MPTPQLELAILPLGYPESLGEVGGAQLTNIAQVDGSDPALPSPTRLSHTLDHMHIYLL